MKKVKKAPFSVLNESNAKKETLLLNSTIKSALIINYEHLEVAEKSLITLET